MAQFIFSLLLKGALLAADVVSDGTVKDLVGDGTGTGAPGLCILHVLGGNSPSNIYATVDCDGDIIFYDLPNFVAGGANPISDSRIGNITVNFVEGNRLGGPWPGDLSVDSDVYTENIGASIVSNVGLDLLAPPSGNKAIMGQGCDGQDVNIIVGIKDRADLDDDDPAYWERYNIVFPLIGGNPGCTTSKRGVEFIA
ncbi:hypothetical protein F4777DRAFT_543288 [Nemania sp. FL0916]|nr:hypothetical protein F4777DRAFT_543288 [Nemania sp. FL0916]